MKRSAAAGTPGSGSFPVWAGVQDAAPGKIPRVPGDLYLNR
ncbi:hypothetical protein [Bacillus salacetis]|nr:hypothetical protein [Bacillus salacetis]